MWEREKWKCRVAEWIKKKRKSNHMLPTKDSLTLRIHVGWKWRVRKQYSMQMVNKKRDVAIFISDIMGLKLKTVIRDKKGHCMIINGLIHQEDITNIPALNIGDPKYMKKKY